ncbi:uncharacterized protein STEHIDRAFT_156669 [Stereum hirsutum FP-91666 SS1]|uniref:uncharacterized protein n=1 Tax=Stereum hirsutum (strain FP-91666) TaxID=721885 RepID=UPI000440EB06|nr:uncharacterized protein STEHIDRAFT_156669 [Stereum hirsutum FP-91666 SS1]EIM86339.1 hypothetical protein STEHIDRAFT_156669 [Stereum hirsutum FP-91666 SS1]
MPSLQLKFPSRTDHTAVEAGLSYNWCGKTAQAISVWEVLRGKDGLLQHFPSRKDYTAVKAYLWSATEMHNRKIRPGRNTLQ